jgi:hypothetical protein
MTTGLQHLQTKPCRVRVTPMPTGSPVPPCAPWWWRAGPIERSGALRFGLWT